MWSERRPLGAGEGNEGWFPRRRHSQSSENPPVPAEVDDTGFTGGSMLGPAGQCRTDVFRHCLGEKIHCRGGKHRQMIARDLAGLELGPGRTVPLRFNGVGMRQRTDPGREKPHCLRPAIGVSLGHSRGTEGGQHPPFPGGRVGLDQEMNSSGDGGPPSSNPEPGEIDKPGFLWRVAIAKGSTEDSQFSPTADCHWSGLNAVGGANCPVPWSLKILRSRTDAHGWQSPNQSLGLNLVRPGSLDKNCAKSSTGTHWLIGEIRPR